METPTTPAEREPSGPARHAIGKMAPIMTGIGTLLIGIAALITAMR
ncbi:hypothetical protein H9Y04_18880 [Streptomyces sp. TRM66268-LWL]|uniref:Uncharacterized protein n=1 Tax=Streptomyces polyasparticus TaxID=2767826 RepID=A0ABR7SJG3_9ACTN|nr:hypothetical protein [Streptomyces polyasparticus]MBC9714626.1 hypothetical protein [Streptomyces polyasparticus]